MKVKDLSNLFTWEDVLKVRECIREELLEANFMSNGVIQGVFRGSDGEYYTHIDLYRQVVHCDCKAFIYNKPCKHLKALVYLFNEYFLKNKQLGDLRRLKLRIYGIYSTNFKRIIFKKC